MKSSLFIKSVALLLALAIFGCGSEQKTWTGSWEEAAARASAGRPVLIAFLRGDVSPHSSKMRSEILESPQFLEWAANRVVLLEVDLSQQAPGDRAAKQSLATRYGILGFPTVVLTDSQGAFLGSLRYTDDGPGPWIAEAEQVLGGKMPPPNPWEHSWDTVAEQSRATGKPILIDFTGSDWCIYCQKLKAEVFDSQTFRDWANQKVLLLELDFPRNLDLDPRLQMQNEEMASRYKVRAFPTVIFTDHTGKQLATLGYLPGGAEAWIKSAETALAETGKP
jgi:protein disulfide-isomerase